jgi:chromosome segregation ATPase
MIADSTDIKFACSQCGQRIVVEKSAAGLDANCPICEAALTVPHFSTVRERGTSHADVERAEYIDPDLEETREELFNSAVEQGHLQRELEVARHEITRLQANATHAQAEIKSFQGDRQQLKADLSHAKHRVLAAENQVAELAAHLAALQEENAALREQIEIDLDVTRERLEATETQLAVRERELATLHTENSEVLQSLAGTQAELAAQQVEMDDLRGGLDSARHLLSEAAQTEARLVAAEHELRARLDEAIAEDQRLRQERDQQREQAEILRHDLTATDSGRELLELRSQLQDLKEDRSRTANALAEKSAEAQALAATENNLRQDLEDTRLHRDDAERRAAANSELQLNKDNEVLRGIIARQNTMLGAHHVEVRRLRRGRFALRTVYALFGLGLIGLAAFALSIFTHHGFADLFKDLLQ